MEDRTLLSSGQLDPSFGYQGIVPLTFGVNEIISYPDGRFLTSGTAYNGGYVPYVARYTADGQPDPTFGTLGMATDSSNVFAANLGGFGVGLEPDGKIVQSVQYNVGAQLVRYNPDGTADLTFGTSGATAPLEISVNGQMSEMSAGYGAIAVLPDGRILMAGDVGSSIGLALYRTDGTLDPSFNGTGTLVVTPDPAHTYSNDVLAGLALEDGKILVQLRNSTADGVGIDLYRFNLDGSADTTFGSGGVIGSDFPNEGFGGVSLVVQPDGRIIQGYQLTTSGTERIVRYDADGLPDPTFGSGGTVTLDASSFEGGLNVTFGNILLQPNGKIVLPVSVGSYPENAGPFYPQIERFNADGSVDSTFGQDGVATVLFSPPAPPGHYGFAPVMQPSGRIIGMSEEYSGSPLFLAGVVGDPVVSLDGATSVSTASGASTAVYDVSETAGSAIITLRRGGDLSQPLSVPFSTDDSGGRAGINYESVNTTVTFAVGSETATVTIPILNDPNASAPVDVPLVLGTPSGGAALGNVSVGDLHIIPVEGIVVSPTQVSSVMQGGAGSSFTVALQSVPTASVTVPLSISTTNPSATLSTSTLTFTPANALTPQTVTVTAAGGSGSSPSTATISVGPATSTDPKYNGLTGGGATVDVYGSSASGPGWIEFAAANFTANESAGTVQVTLVRLGGSSGSVSVHLATSDGTYEAAGKYTPLSGSISFGAGVTSKTITITLIDPGRNLQGDQTVDLTLSNPTGGAQLGVFPTATLTLHDTSQPVAGDLDSSFGADGESILPDGLATASVMASQPDGKLVIAGTGGTANDGTSLVRVWRTDAAGHPDPGFGVQGVALIPFPNFVQVKGIAIGADGKIVVVGNAAKPAGGNEFALLRLNADGSLDTGFGSDGLVTTSFSPGDDMPGAVFVESDESIYVAGTLDTANDAAQPFAFAHYGPDGSLDLGFGNGGAQIIPAVAGPAGAVLQQPDGKWLVISGGGYDPNFGDDLPGSAVRLDSDFTTDSTFGTAGVATLSWSEFYDSAALQPDGKILIGGGEAASGAATLGRLNPDGSLDTTFGSGGSASTVFDVTSGGDFGITSAFSSLLVQPDGQIVAIGEADDVGVGGHYFTAEARYRSDGSPDTTFGDGGSRWFTPGDGNDGVAGAVILPDGNVAIAETSAGLPLLASIQTAGSLKTPTITWPDPASIVYGTALGAAQLDATASVPGTFTYSPAAGTVLAAGSHTLSLTFTPTDTTDETTAISTATISVSRATPTITWANPASIVYGTALGPLQLDATASVPGTFTYSPALDTLLHAGNNQTLSVTFTPSDTNDDASATATVSINVSQATPTIIWANPVDIPPGIPLGAAQLDAAASVPGTFTYTPPAGTILGAGANQTLAVSFTPTDTADDTSATATVHINVENIGQTIPTIIWPVPADLIAGTPLGAAQLDATASVAGTFSYSPPAGTILPIGDGQRLEVTFTPADATQYVATTATVSINVTNGPLQTPTIDWPDPAAIAYGTALDANELDARASVPGTFTYWPPAGTILGPGDHQVLSVTFTPFDATAYATATSQTTIDVIPTPPPAPPQLLGIEGTSQTKKGLTAITIGFNEAMDPGSVGTSGLYSVLGAVKKHRKVVYTRRVAIGRISFDGDTRVTINFARPYKGTVKLTILGGMLAADGASSDINFSAIVG